MNGFLIQREQANSTEARAIKTAAALRDFPVEYVDDLNTLLSEECVIRVPVGSVEFVRGYADLVGIDMPDPIDYPYELNAFLGRDIELVVLGSRSRLLGRFIKPYATKAFTPRIIAHRSDVPKKLPPTTPVWSSSVVEFTSEFRVYVLNGEMVGHAQYDAGPSVMLDTVHLGRIERMVDAWTGQPKAFALDVGLLHEDSIPDMAVGVRGIELALVEINDGWGTGYYPDAMEATVFADWLAARWAELLESTAKAAA